MSQSSAYSVKNIQEWIIDTGATNHMVADVNLLDKLAIVSRGVYLPNGVVAQVTHPGSSSVTARTSLTNVLYLPQFKFNLIYVSKLTKKLGCSVSFFPDFCLFQDLSNGRVREICREENGLYVLTGSTKLQQPQSQNNGCVLAIKDSNTSQVSADVELWHQRIGHAFIRSLNKIISVKIECIANTLNNCTIFPHAK
uniref:Integrase core domain containing protein n=1 Tax=Solanum tuberosum TaxID=4113 RepID=M1ANP4_SOLTU